MKRFRLRILSFPLLSLLATSAFGSDTARVITSFESATNCISKVNINSIDGKEVRVPAAGLNLEPGEHTLTGRGIINTAFCRAHGNPNTAPSQGLLVAEFEAGKTYYVGYDHSSLNREDWGLVIWKVKD